MASSSRWRSWGVAVLKLAASATLLWVLLRNPGTAGPELLARLRDESVNWGRLACGWALLATSLVAVWVRLYIGLRAAGSRVRFRDVLEVGVASFALDFLAIGVVGGDVVKAFALARRDHEHRERAVAGVLVDRALGVTALLALISLVSASSGASPPSALFPLVIAARVGLTAVLGATAALWWFGPSLIDRFDTRASDVASLRLRALGAVARQYRDHVGLVVAAIGLAGGVIVAQTVGYHLLATAFPGPSPTLGESSVAIPIGLFSTMIPLPGDSLGASDVAMGYLFEGVTEGRVPAAQALAMMMAGRVVSALMSVVGLWRLRALRPVLNAVRREGS